MFHYQRSVKRAFVSTVLKCKYLHFSVKGALFIRRLDSLLPLFHCSVLHIKVHVASGSQFCTRPFAIGVVHFSHIDCLFSRNLYPKYTFTR